MAAVPLTIQIPDAATFHRLCLALCPGAGDSLPALHQAIVDYMVRSVRGYEQAQAQQQAIAAIVPNQDPSLT